MLETGAVGRSDQKCCNPGPVQRVGWGYGSKVLPLAGSMPSERQRLGAAKAGVRVEIAGRGSEYRDEREDYGG